METTLHRQLKERYAGASGRQEVRVAGYRIDACDGRELIEIQLGSLAAIRGKVQRLVRHHPVRVVKPLVAAKYLVRRAPGRRAAVTRRKSPLRQQWLDLVHELIYFARLYPHPHLTLEIPLVDIEELRVTDRRCTSRRRRGYRVEDLRLVGITEIRTLRTAADLRTLAPCPLPDPFHTQHLADRLQTDRWIAQRVAYCWRLAGTIRQVGRSGNTRLYRFARPSPDRSASMREPFAACRHDLS